MTNKKANQHFKKIKDCIIGCETYEQLLTVGNMIENFKLNMPEAVEEVVRLKYLYDLEEKKYTAKMSKGNWVYPNTEAEKEDFDALFNDNLSLEIKPNH